jgi:nucleotide-binding universal stress UspA family protein
MQPQRILAPVDFSDHSRAGLASAAALAKKYGAALLVLHVQPPPMPLPVAVAGLPVADPGLLEPRDLSEAEERVRAFVRETLGDAPVAGVHVVEDFPISRAILRFAEARGVDLVCLCAHGRRGFQRFLLGSVAEETIRWAKVPVLVIRGGEGGPRPSPAAFRRVLACVDLGEESRSVLRAAVSLALPGGTVTAAHVIEGPPVLGLYGSPLEIPAEDVAAAREWAEIALVKLLEEMDGDYVESVRVVLDRAAEGILALEAELKPDVTVLSTHGRHGAERMLLGSVAERVVRGATGPVLVIPSAARRASRGRE